jgi:hypothetical protein
MSTRFPLTLAFLCVVGGRASVEVNLLPQGTFENPRLTTGWAEGFNIPNNQEFRVLSEGGKHWLRIENRDAGRQFDSVHAYVKVTPQIASLTVSARLRATGLKTGKEGWHIDRERLRCCGGCGFFPKGLAAWRVVSSRRRRAIPRRAQGAAAGSMLPCFRRARPWRVTREGPGREPARAPGRAPVSPPSSCRP